MAIVPKVPHITLVHKKVLLLPDYYTDIEDETGIQKLENLDDYPTGAEDISIREALRRNIIVAAKAFLSNGKTKIIYFEVEKSVALSSVVGSELGSAGIDIKRCWKPQHYTYG